jgi:hypothetical protein
MVENSGRVKVFVMSTTNRKFQFDDGTWRELRVLTKEEHKAAYLHWQLYEWGFFGLSGWTLLLCIFLGFGVISQKDRTPWLLVTCGSLAGWYYCTGKMEKGDPRTRRLQRCDPTEIPASLRVPIEQDALSATITVAAATPDVVSVTETA